MGCDIHAFVEYKNYGKDNWRSLGGEFRLTRHYGMFGMLAKVRTEPKEGLEPKGFPENADSDTRSAYCYYITDNPDPKEREISKEQAEKAIAEGRVKKIGDHWISDCDWHSASSISLHDLQGILSLPDVLDSYGDLETYKAVTAMMRSLMGSGFDTRLVFWFDN